jgi:hypothetical protein
LSESAQRHHAVNSLNLVIARFGDDDRDGGRPGLHRLAV